MKMFVYDGSWMGLLTAFFEVYEYKFSEPFISVENNSSASLFSEAHKVHTNEEKAERVLIKLKQKVSLKSYRELYKTFLSEEKGRENIMLNYVKYILKNKISVENNYAQTDVLYLHQTSRKVDREKHRMEAFVRFQCTKDELYYSIIQPDYNVLPLIIPHFKNRYADQKWLIYDAMRKYGIYYDLKVVSEVQIDFSADQNNKTELKNVYDENESLYQVLWQQYFKSINIAARKNTKLHIQHMPKRYWKYLVEKQG